MQKSYSFSTISFAELTKIVTLEKAKNAQKFATWFEADYTVPEIDVEFLEQLIEEHSLILPPYSEEDLKMKFAAKQIPCSLKATVQNSAVLSVHSIVFSFLPFDCLEFS